MIRRKSTLDLAERAKRTKFVEIYAVLDLCLQLTSDDRLIIRNCIKNGDDQLAERIYQCKKDKNYQNLQIYLRKVIKDIKQNDKFGIGMMKGRGKTPITLKSAKNATESSAYNSVNNSMQSTPSAKKQKHSTAFDMQKSDIERHIEKQINKEIKNGIRKQQCEVVCRGVTPRQIQVQGKKGESQNKKSKPLQFSKKLFTNQIKLQQSSIKDLIKNKLTQKQKSHQILPQLPTIISCELTAESIRNSFKYNERVRNKMRQNRVKQGQNKQNRVQYGQFYKRIKKVIEQAR